MQALELLWFLATLNGTKNIPLEYPVRVSPEARGRSPGFPRKLVYGYNQFILNDDVNFYGIWTEHILYINNEEILIKQ